MRTSKFTGWQMAYALKQAELGVGVEEVCRKMGSSGDLPPSANQSF
jgi:putative transposase